MESNEFVKDYRNYVSSAEAKYCKATLFENDAILVGINCFEPGQEMSKHAHTEQNRFYIVLEGQGTVRVDDVETVVVKDKIILVPGGHAHRLFNSGKERFIVLVGIAPAHAD